MAEAKGEAKVYTFSHQAVATALIKQQGIHEGIWGVYVEFGIGAANVKHETSDSILPAAIVPVVKIGIQRFEDENNLTVDAAKVNPPPTTSKAKK